MVLDRADAVAQAQLALLQPLHLDQIGGGVLMWNAAEPQAVIRARDLETRIEALRLAHGPATLAVGASAGVMSLSGELDAAAVIDAADKAMYARKKERR